MVQLQGRDATATAIQPPLSQAVGYIIVVVLGMIVATGMSPITAGPAIISICFVYMESIMARKK
jgi:hypothetical protein